MIFLSTLLASVVLTALAVPVLSRLALRYSLVDVPNERKVHKQPIPRVGGLAMAVGMIVPVGFWMGDYQFVRAFLASSGVLILFGLLDDLIDLRPAWKLVGQVTAASIAVSHGGVRITSLGMLVQDGFLLPVWIAVPFTIFVIVGVTNAINLSDGLDGLAGGISLLSLCCLSYLAYAEGDTSIGMIALALAGATFGFLRYNTYPASIFMGDTGSQLLGFSSITLALALTQGDSPLSPVLPLILLGFPILDTVTVMCCRIARGRSPFCPDKTHFHHALLDLGLKHDESVMMIYVIQVSLITMAFLLRYHSDRLLLVLYLTFSFLVLLLFSRARSRNWTLRRKGTLAVVGTLFDRLRSTSVINCLFRPLELGLVTILAMSAALVEKVPLASAVAAATLIAALILISRFRATLLGDALKVTLYLVIPLMIYHSALRIESLPSVIPVFLYRLSFGILALLNILVSRLTRRTHGFQSTPLDFLVLLIAFVAPQLPQAIIPVFSLGIIAAKIIICCFSCEVVFAESRGEWTRMMLGTLTILVVVVLRGMM